MKSYILLLLTAIPALALAQGTKLLRQPTIHGNDVVFIYANDLWKSSINGGDAVRLTSDTGYELSPHYSNDGSMIAFSAQYDGNFDVFVIPAAGGTPKRLTYHPASDFVQGWTPDGKVLFRSDREGKPTETTRFFTIGTDDAFPTALPLKRAAYGEISEDGTYIAYTPITSWDSEWRNYRGGQAMPIWIVNMKTNELQTTSQPTKERHLEPVWHKGVVYFISERDYTSNIWSYDPATKIEKQHTFHKKFDVKSLDADSQNIIYEHGGTLKILNPATGTIKELEITVRADLNFSRPRWETVTGRNLLNPNLSPQGQRALFEYRGELFTVPKENGSWRNITNSPGVADRNPIWSPQGDKIAWFSDASGEYSMVIADQFGENQRSIDLPEPTFYFKPDWSPDGKHIAYTDTHYNIWILNVDSGKTSIVATDSYAHPNRSMNPVWSPDSKFIAYARQQQSHFKAIFAYNVDTKKTIQLTDPIADAITPVWDASGKYLYTLASTDYGLASGWLDMSSYDPKTTRSLYAIVLSKDGKAPNLPDSDEEKAAAKKDEDDSKNKKSKKNDDDKKDNPAVTVVIDEEGIYDRAIAMDLPARNYVALAMAAKNFVLVAESVPNEDGLEVHLYDVKKQKAETFAKGINGMTSSSNGEHVLLESKGAWSIQETKGKADLAKNAIKTNMQLLVDPQAEYPQIFKEGWRYMRDFLYVDNQHGAPWDEVYEWYAPWIQHVRHRSDLNYVVDIMSGEIAIGHSYVSGGDMPDVKNVPVGLLGADLERTSTGY
ncbi:MAG: protease, partial [Nonlabens sp.]|nr:protease [Nonlabens sp.]